VELVDVKTAVPLWGPVSYDRDEGDVPFIEDELATAIVEDGVRLKLSPNDRNDIARHGTNNREADKLYRLALAHLDRETKADNLTARDLLLKAIDRDPKFARAYAAISRTYGSMVIDGYEPPEEGFRQMTLYANNALLLDPTISDAHGSLGTELFWRQRKWREAEQQFKIAMQTPGAPASYEPYVWLLLATKRGGAALALARRAQDDDPVSLKWRLREADILISLGRVGDAEKAYQNIVRDSPEDYRAYLGLANIRRMQKQFPAAIKLMSQAFQAAGETDAAVLDLLKRAQGEEGYLAIQKREAELELQHLQKSSATYVSSLDFARAHARLGQTDQAFSYLDRAFAEGAPGLALLNVDPAWESIRDDARFAQAAARAGLP
jgi:Tfp pilus assembly protein PilF